MRFLLFLILFISIKGYGQTDPLNIYKKQIELDSIELIKVELRIRCLKLELDSLKTESEKRQIFIDQLKQENIVLVELMKKYIEQINRRKEEE